METLIIDGNHLTLEDVIRVARNYQPIKVADDAIELVNQSRKIVDDIVESGKVVYGINTGFGSLVRERISKEDSAQLQENLIRSHASGFGDPLNEETVRAVMLIRINSLIKGFSGIRLETIETLVKMLNANVLPQIPEKGSLGASGDLAPLSHMVLPMLGLGYATYEGHILDGAEAMNQAGIPIISLSAKEGLALINGTTVLTAIGALATYDGIQLAKLADIAGALSLEAHGGITSPFEDGLHTIRPHEGQLATARNIWKLVDGSHNTTVQTAERVQDAYSLRCMPQVHGACKDTISYVLKRVEIEINAVTDNPIIQPNGHVISGGNFHGEPMAQPFDFLKIALADLGGISERRVERLVNRQLSGLNSFLVKHPGLNSGFMITQYACAALASENKVLAHPASVDSIPSCENQEDYVSMGTIAARQAREIYENTHRIIATEMMAAAQAIDLAEVNEHLAPATQIAYDYLRQHVDFIAEDKDIQMADEIDKVSQALQGTTLVDAVESVVELALV